MQSFELLSQKFSLHFERSHFPAEPASLYAPNEYFLKMGGKRVRPVLCLMGNELFDEVIPSAWEVATAIELFHNFTLIHDDIMDQAPLRRGMETIHNKFGGNTALLAGDVMLVTAYEYLNKIDTGIIHAILSLFNQTAKEVCEGQQLDMDFEKQDGVKLDEYIHMISLKTSVLLAGSLQMGAILGGASLGNQQHIYEFGRNLGIAFQVQDDYLDAFGDPEKFGKEVGGDIKANKKTFLVIGALAASTPSQQRELQELLQGQSDDKVERVVSIFKERKVDEWARELKQDFMKKAIHHLDEIAVISKRKEPLAQLAQFLMQREF